MKSKKWIIITVISVVLLAGAIIFGLVGLLPMINKNRALDALAEGDKQKATELLADMDTEKLNSLKDDVKDIVVYSANQYLTGKKTYDETYKVMDAVENIRTYKGMTAEAFQHINIPKLLEIYEEGAAIYGDDSKSTEFNNKTEEFRHVRRAEKDSNSLGLYYGWDTTVADNYDKAIQEALDGRVKELYESYDAGNMGYEEISRYVNTATTFWYSDYAFELSNELYYANFFMKELEEMQGFIDTEEYFSAMREMKYLKEYYAENNVWPKWEDKFQAVYDDAVNKGKTYYVEKALSYVADGDKYSAEYLMDDMKEYFGEDFDVSAIEAAIEDASHEQWQKDYVDWMYAWQDRIAEDQASAAMTAELYDPSLYTMNDFINQNYITLYDFDRNGVPELIVGGDKLVVVYTWKDNKVTYTGFMQPVGMNSSGYMVVKASETVEGVTVYADALIHFDGDDWDLEDAAAYAEREGETLYVTFNEEGDVAASDEETYTQRIEKINGYIETQVPRGAAIDQFENYIFSYEK